MCHTTEMDNTATKLVQIARIATVRPTEKFTSLMHLLNAEYFYECFKELKKRKAAGIDGRTVESYTEEEIKQTLTQTVTLIKQKRYHPKPVRRVDILKDNGKTRTLGIPIVVDKVIQMAIAKILKAIYEPLFLSVSYGYRDGKDAHGCLKQVNHMIMQKKINWIIDADISGYFDNINHTWMMRCLQEKIKDPNLLSLIMRFLKAGIMQGNYQATDKGTPQGGIVSPVLANIYLHFILDLWFEKQEKKDMKGYTELIRYADDFLIGVQLPEEAKQILYDLSIRLKKFGLTLSKERVIEFGRFSRDNTAKRKPDTFDFLGFTHYCSQTRDGRFAVKVKTSSRKLNLAINSVNLWLKGKRSTKLKEIWPILKSKLQGHYNYYGVSGNFEELKRYYQKTKGKIFYWNNRRSQKKTWNWNGFERYLSQYPLPKPKLTYAIYNTW